MTAVRVIILRVGCTGNWKVLGMESILGVMVLAIRDDEREGCMLGWYRKYNGAGILVKRLWKYFERRENEIYQDGFILLVL